MSESSSTQAVGAAAWYLLSKQQLVVTAFFAVFFIYFNYMPLYHSDIWGHVLYGQWILDHGRLPETDPFVPLAEGVRIVDTAWLSQVLLGSLERAGGGHWLSHVFALTRLATYVLLGRAFFLQTGRWGWALGGVVLSLAIVWGRLAFIRPEIFGSFCFAALLWLLVRNNVGRNQNPAVDEFRWQAPSGSIWFAVPVLFLLWANLHGSFAVGLVVLGCVLTGEIIEAARRGRLAADSAVKRWGLLLLLAAGATLLNPYGIGLHVYTATFGNNPNLSGLTEWRRLELFSIAGGKMGASWIVAAVVLAFSRRRLGWHEVVLLAVFTVAACLRVRMVSWYAPILVLVLMPCLRLPSARRRGSNQDEERNAETTGNSRSSLYTALTLAVAWIGLTLSPFGGVLLAGRSRPPERLYSHRTPRGVTQYLRKDPPGGLVFHPLTWGDWLLWEGPAEMQVFVNTNTAHVLPHTIWQQYEAVSEGAESWESILQQHGIRTVLVHRQEQRRLAAALRQDSDWQFVHQTRNGLIARKVP